MEEILFTENMILTVMAIGHNSRGEGLASSDRCEQIVWLMKKHNENVVDSLRKELERSGKLVNPE